MVVSSFGRLGATVLVSAQDDLIDGTAGWEARNGDRDAYLNENCDNGCAEFYCCQLLVILFTNIAGSQQYVLGRLETPRSVKDAMVPSCTPLATMTLR